MDYFENYMKHVIESAKSSEELRQASIKLETTTAELRRMKIDILKNGSRKDKINLLIEERLQALENEEKSYMENLKNQVLRAEQELREYERFRN